MTIYQPTMQPQEFPLTTDMIYAVWYALEDRGLLRELAEVGLDELICDLETFADVPPHDDYEVTQ